MVVILMNLTLAVGLMTLALVISWMTLALVISWITLALWLMSHNSVRLYPEKLKLEYWREKVQEVIYCRVDD